MKEKRTEGVDRSEKVILIEVNNNLRFESNYGPRPGLARLGIVDYLLVFRSPGDPRRLSNNYKTMSNQRNEQLSLHRSDFNSPECDCNRKAFKIACARSIRSYFRQNIDRAFEFPRTTKAINH